MDGAGDPPPPPTPDPWNVVPAEGIAPLIVWLWLGISGIVKACASSPPVAARFRKVNPVPWPAPTTLRDRASGTLKVVDPSPAPNVVPITANKAASVVRFFAV